MKNLQSQTFSFGEVELSYKRKQASTFKTIKSSDDAITCIRKIFPVNQINYREHMFVLFMNMKNEIIGYHLNSVGGVSQTIIDIRIIMQGALLSNAVGILLCHNHPSGNLKPSEQDKRLTQKIIKAGKLLDINVLDHVIITENSHYSFADHGEI